MTRVYVVVIYGMCVKSHTWGECEYTRHTLGKYTANNDHSLMWCPVNFFTDVTQKTSFIDETTRDLP